MQGKARGHPKVRVRLGAQEVESRGNGQLSAVVVKDLATGETEELHPGAVFIFIGLDPNAAFVRDLVDVDKRGFIQTDPTLQTSVEGIFAAGDVRQGSTKQVASAVGEGATAALMIRQYLEKTEGSRGYSGD